MSEGVVPRRWQYLYLWRYGPLVLVVMGFLMILNAMLADRSDAVIIAWLTLGLISVITGVILPRAEGDFRATSTGVAGSLLRVTELDVGTADFAVSGPAIASAGLVERDDRAESILIGDVWEKLLRNNFEVVEGMLGSRALQDADGREVVLPALDAAGSREASPELLTTIRAWGIEPTASGRYRSAEWMSYESGSGPQPRWLKPLLSRTIGVPKRD
jgi:hypothetical protein